MAVDGRGAPGDHITAGVEHRDTCVSVVVGLAAAVAYQHLAANLDTSRCEALGHGGPAPQVGVVADPAHDEVAVGEYCHIAIRLLAGRVGVDGDFGAARRAVCVHEPGVHAPAAAVLLQ